MNVHLRPDVQHGDLPSPIIADPLPPHRRVAKAMQWIVSHPSDAQTTERAASPIRLRRATEPASTGWGRDPCA